MFGLFKKKQPTAMDAVVRMIYGDNPPSKSANLEQAIAIAHEELLCKEVPVSEIRRIASGLAAGPIPYSTYDLALAATLGFFKDAEYLRRLWQIQIIARMRAAHWTKEGKVAPGVLKIFEDTLYNTYKPLMEAADNDLESKFNDFKKQNAGSPLHHAVTVVREFFRWQRGEAVSALFDILVDNPTEAQREHAKRIERAFLMGAAGVAAEGFSVSQENERLFILNIAAILSPDPDEVEYEIAKMFEASEIEEKATSVGGSAMIHYLANGKNDDQKVMLASLQLECWKQ